MRNIDSLLRSFIVNSLATVAVLVQEGCEREEQNLPKPAETWDYLTKLDFGRPIRDFGRPANGTIVGVDTFFQFHLPGANLEKVRYVFENAGVGGNIEWSRRWDDQEKIAALGEFVASPSWWRPQLDRDQFVIRLSEDGKNRINHIPSGSYTVFWDPAAKTLLVKKFKA